MNCNSHKPWLAILALFLLTGSSLAQAPDDRRPKSILDYYFLLPQKYLSYLKADSRPVREAAIRIKDLDGAFLKSGLETDEVSTTVALFKKSDSSDVIAVENRSCAGGCCTSSITLLSYANDQWADVTHELLPAIHESTIQGLLQRQYISRPNESMPKSLLIYTLRKNGGSIDVNEHWSGMVLGQFEWANDAFIFKSEDGVGSNYSVLAATENSEGDRLQIIGIDPEPASLPLNGHLRIRIAYQLKSGKHGLIWATPVVLEQRLPDYFTSGSYRHKPGSGFTTAWFGFNNQAHLDLLKVTMADDQQKTILTLTYPIDANWKGRLECPRFRVACFPNTNSSGAPLACMVYPSGVLPGQEFTYQWNVSTGSIASGQGTRRIIVDQIGTEAKTITADLEIGNLPLTCERKASFTGSIRPRSN